MENLPLEPPPPPPSLTSPRRVRLHLILLAVTFVTLTMSGAWWWSDVGDEAARSGPLSPQVLVHGVPYALLVILILGAHEMGHYLACRRYGVPATLPFFIPGLPLLIGTFGAVIRIKGPIPSRKALFDIAAAGPIAGFVVGLPVLAIGAALAQPMPPPATDQHGLFLSPPLVSWILERAFHGETDLRVGSFYGAAWVGMLITSMNLFPVGQLDGGHAVFAVTPKHHRAVSWATIVALGGFIAVQAIVWGTVSSYTLWLGVLLILRDRHPRLVEEAAPLDRRRRAVALALAVMLALTFIPIPLTSF